MMQGLLVYVAERNYYLFSISTGSDPFINIIGTRSKSKLKVLMKSSIHVVQCK